MVSTLIGDYQALGARREEPSRGLRPSGQVPLDTLSASLTPEIGVGMSRVKSLNMTVYTERRPPWRRNVGSEPLPVGKRAADIGSDPLGNTLY